MNRAIRMQPRERAIPLRRRNSRWENSVSEAFGEWEREVERFRNHTGRCVHRKSSRKVVGLKCFLSAAKWLEKNIPRSSRRPFGILSPISPVRLDSSIENGSKDEWSLAERFTPTCVLTGYIEDPARNFIFRTERVSVTEIHRKVTKWVT